MNIDGLGNDRKAEPVTVELLKKRSHAYKENPSIHVYIEEVLNQQKELYGYVSNEVKMKN